MPTGRFEIPFVGPAYKGLNPFLNPQECVNYFLEPYQTMKGNKLALRGCPGLTTWANLATGAAIDGMIKIGSYLMAVSNAKLFKISSAKAVTEIGSIDISGTVQMAQNGLQAMIATPSTQAYIYTLADDSLVRITDTDFPGASSVTFQDGFFIVGRPNTASFYKSHLNDGLNWDSDDYSTAAWKPDNILSVFSDHRDLWLGGEETIELWYNNASSSEFPFSRREGTELEIGLAAKHSFGGIDNGVFFLGRDRNGYGYIFRCVGYQPAIISTPPITEAINSYSDISDAISSTYYIDNNSMYELTFPTADKTWVFDSSQNQWHERRSRISGVTGRHRVQNHVFFDNKHLMGSISDGKIYEHSRQVYDEDGEELEATRTTLAFQNNQDMITVNELQVLYTPGVGLVSGQGSDPLSIISWSKDGGKTWSNERQVSIGKMGEYENRARVLQLGQGRNWIVRAKITDPVNRDILGAVAMAEVDET